MKLNWSRLIDKPKVHFHRMKLIYDDDTDKIWRNVTPDYVTYYRCSYGKRWYMAIEKDEK